MLIFVLWLMARTMIRGTFRDQAGNSTNLLFLNFILVPFYHKFISPLSLYHSVLYRLCHHHWEQPGSVFCISFHFPSQVQHLHLHIFIKYSWTHFSPPMTSLWITVQRNLHSFCSRLLSTF